MNDTYPALSELRRATRALHEQLESALPVAKPDAGYTEFLHYLQDMWGWLSRFEERLWCAPWPMQVQAEMRHGKLAWIEGDLRAAGMSDTAIAALPLPDYDPALDTPARRFGVAYVIEGAQLGTRVLARTLAPALAGWAPRWLQGYGEDQAGYWRSFMQATEHALSTPDERREAAAAAAEAFHSLAAWFAQRQRVREADQEMGTAHGD